MDNAHFQWLGLPADCISPNHYQLLGLADFESDHLKIRENAMQRTEKVRKYQLGPDAEKALRIIAKLAEAFSSLSDPQRKAAYDEQLRLGTTADGFNFDMLDTASTLPTAPHPSNRNCSWEPERESQLQRQLELDHAETRRIDEVNAEAQRAQLAEQVEAVARHAAETAEQEAKEAEAAAARAEQARAVHEAAMSWSVMTSAHSVGARAERAARRAEVRQSFRRWWVLMLASSLLQSFERLLQVYDSGYRSLRGSEWLSFLTVVIGYNAFLVLFVIILGPASAGGVALAVIGVGLECSLVLHQYLLPHCRSLVLQLDSHAHACERQRKELWRGLTSPGSLVSTLVAENCDAAIRFQCSCGRNLRARTALAGKRVRCPACHQRVVVPGIPPQIAGTLAESVHLRLESGHAQERAHKERSRCDEIEGWRPNELPLVVDHGTPNSTRGDWTMALLAAGGTLMVVLGVASLAWIMAKEPSLQSTSANSDVVASAAHNDPSNEEFDRMTAAAEQSERWAATVRARTLQRENEQQIALEKQRASEEEQRRRDADQRLSEERENEYRTEYAKLTEIQKSTVTLCETAFLDMARKIDNLVLGCRLAWQDIKKESDPDKRRYLEEEFRIKTNRSIDQADAELTKLLAAIGSRMQLPPYFVRRWNTAKDEQIRRLTRASNGFHVE